MSPRTPDNFPGTRIEEVVQFESGSYTPLLNGEVAYVSGSGFRFLDEGVLRNLVSSSYANFALTASLALSASSSTLSQNSITASFAHKASGSIAQSLFREITIDTSTTSTTPVNLLVITASISSSRNEIKVDFTSANSIIGGSNCACIFRLQIDGVTKRGALAGGGTGATNSPGQSCALTYQTSSLSPGNHIFTMQWAVNTSGRTGRIRPSTVYEHASLIVQEIIR